MSADTCPVVLIKSKHGFTRINESDFDPKIHELYEPAPVEADAELMPIALAVIPPPPVA